jgi:hypothetical protein
MPTPGNERVLWLGMALGMSEPSSLMTDVKALLAKRVGQAGTNLLLINGPSIP